jgi:hypothetical protein
MESTGSGDEQAVMESNNDWVHPFVAGYSCHTANFISAQVLVWSRVLYLIGFDIMYVSDWVSGAVLLAGIALSVPYTVSIFRRAELVVDGGPSLINGLIPEWLTTMGLLAISVFLGIADAGSGWHSISLSWLMYIFAGLGSVVFGLLSKNHHNQRVLVSTAGFMICIHLASDYTDQAFRAFPAITLGISYVFDAMEVTSNRSVLGAFELSTYRYRMTAKLALAACMLFRVHRYVTLIVVLSIIACDFALYFAERRLGDIYQRQFLRNVPPRRIPLQVTD